MLPSGVINYNMAGKSLIKVEGQFIELNVGLFIYV